MRRLLGPVGGPVVFFLVALLVFAGLGWVTYAALGVEQAQREAHARAEMGNSLRDALWRLDGRMLPALGVEDSRPVYHYDSADPAGIYGPAATPLLVATLPEWMKLHFQLDPTNGWRSNQAPDNRGEAERISEAWSPLLRNWFGGREDVLAELKAKLPVAATCETFAARDQAMPADSLPFASPLFAEVNPGSQSQPNPPAQPASLSPSPQLLNQGFNQPSSPDPSTETIHVLGFEICLCQNDAKQQAANAQVGNSARIEPETSQKKSESQGRQQQVSQNPGTIMVRGGGGGRGGGPNDADSEYAQRVKTMSKGREEAKGAYDSPIARNASQNYPQNALQSQFDFKNNFNSGPTDIGMPPGDEKDKSAGPPPGAPGGPQASPAGNAGGFNPRAPITRATDPRVGRGPEWQKAAANGNIRSLLAGLFDRNRQPREAADPLVKDLGADRKFEDETAHTERSDSQQKAYDGGRNAQATVPPPGWAKPVGAAPPVPPIGDLPPSVVPATTTPLLPAPIPLHLGSMRPQWVTAPDGTEMLILVRVARFENRTIFQGVVLDWPKLQEELKAQVQDLFPDARLVPVKDPDGVSPGRAMATLPVQLDVGPEPELPPAGWTPLRIGLVLAWIAAIIAVAAVGFSGWSLIDLAERRIRFVSAVTHELRTPLTSLRLYLDLLVSGMIQDEAKRQEYLNTLATESDRLHRLIDNVLDFAKLEKRRKDGDIKPVKVCDLLDLLRATWTDRVAQDGKELVVMSMLPAECEVNTDPAMIQQIVGNLIDNARKYTRDAGEKRIWLWAKPGRGKGVVLEVEDRGPGVPAGERRSIFKPFRRGEHADTRAGGAGLGLALAKSWAEVLGGRLTYRPADGGTGACFRLELPG